MRAAQIATGAITSLLAFSIILLVLTDSENIRVPANVLAVVTPLLVLLLGWWMQQAILRNREVQRETQRIVKEEILTEIHDGISQMLGLLRACLKERE